MYKGLIEQYRDWLPVSESTPVISLQEGRTPLISAPKLAAWIDPHITLYLKVEGANPTGSFKDRGMTMAISKAAEDGKTVVMCASTGNTSASAAAYAARAGMECIVLIPGGKIALGKLAQALMHGARVVAIDGNFDVALRLVRDITANYPIALVNSVNPFRLEGQKTAAFEIVDDLGDAPDFHSLPVGNAGNITAYWRGFQEYAVAGKSTRLPAMLGFQAENAAPIVDGRVVVNPETVATAIRIGNPASWQGALKAKEESGGRIEKVSDADILEAYSAVARLEGVFAEPASVVPIAGLRQIAREGFFMKDCVVTVTLTGNGLKDPETAIRENTLNVDSIEATKEAVLHAIGY